MDGGGGDSRGHQPLIWSRWAISADHRAVSDRRDDLRGVGHMHFCHPAGTNLEILARADVPCPNFVSVPCPLPTDHYVANQAYAGFGIGMLGALMRQGDGASGACHPLGSPLACGAGLDVRADTPIGTSGSLMPQRAGILGAEDAHSEAVFEGMTAPPDSGIPRVAHSIIFRPTKPD